MYNDEEKEVFQYHTGNDQLNRIHLNSKDISIASLSYGTRLFGFKQIHLRHIQSGLTQVQTI